MNYDEAKKALKESGYGIGNAISEKEAGGFGMGVQGYLIKQTLIAPENKWREVMAITHVTNEDALIKLNLINRDDFKVFMFYEKNQELLYIYLEDYLIHLKDQIA